MKPICNLILIFLLLIECNLKMMQMDKDFFSQKNALLKLYQSTNGMNWHPCNWADKLNENPCGWCGIYCRKNTTEVIGIELMENNLIGEINDSISDLIYLKEMRLSGNNISSLPSSLSRLNLTLLWVQNNTITDVSLIAWSNFGFLTDLRIFRNPIQSIPNSLFFLPIVRLDLSFTEISSFPNQIYSKSTIKHIVAHNNNLGPSFPQVLCSIEKIEMIDLSYNQILQIEGDIFECGNLKSLFLSNNFIQFLPQFDGGSLDILDLSFNNISFVVDSLKNVEISKLIVSDNRIEVITPPKSITSLSAQTYLSVTIFSENHQPCIKTLSISTVSINASLSTQTLCSIRLEFLTLSILYKIFTKLKFIHIFSITQIVNVQKDIMFDFSFIVYYFYFLKNF